MSPSFITQRSYNIRSLCQQLQVAIVYLHLYKNTFLEQHRIFGVIVLVTLNDFLRIWEFKQWYDGWIVILIPFRNNILSMFNIGMNLNFPQYLQVIVIKTGIYLEQEKIPIAFKARVFFIEL